MSFTVKNLSVSHAATPVLSNVDLDLHPGQVTGLIGPNGVGKSSLLRGLAGLAPCTGEIRLNNVSSPPDHRRKQIAYMPQDTSAISSLTLIEVVLLGRVGSLGLRIPGGMIKAAEQALADFGLSALVNRTLDTVSGGQRQLTYLAQALFREPRMLMLDEPTAALDLRHQLIVLESLQQLARTKSISVIIALHDLALAAQFCDQLVCLSNGGIEGTGRPRDILTQDRIRRVYGVEAEIHDAHGRSLRITPLRAV